MNHSCVILFAIFCSKDIKLHPNKAQKMSSRLYGKNKPLAELKEWQILHFQPFKTLLDYFSENAW